MSACATCKAEIRWVKTQRGAAMPLDVDPADDGRFVVLDGVAVVCDPLFHPREPRYRSHFASCPQAAQHRRKRG